jgi:chemotaxis protein MotB
MNEERPVIRIVKKKGHSGHHGGAWKVAYADFVTAMMAFFLVMWILGLNQDTREAIAAYFKDPTGVMKMLRGGPSTIGVMSASPESKPAVLPSLQHILEGGEMEKKYFQEAKKSLEKMIAQLPEWKQLRPYIEIKLTPEGLRIELMEGPKSLFFETGSAKLKPATEHLLRSMARELRKLDNPVIIEGHTDAHPYAGGIQGYSNWELSTDRANSARRAIMPALRPGQIREVRGYADTHPRNPDPYHFSNRRISLLVPYTHSQPSSIKSAAEPTEKPTLRPTPPNIKPASAPHKKLSVP